MSIELIIVAVVAVSQWFTCLEVLEKSPSWIFSCEVILFWQRFFTFAKYNCHYVQYNASPSENWNIDPRVNIKIFWTPCSIWRFIIPSCLLKYLWLIIKALFLPFWKYWWRHVWFQSLSIHLRGLLPSNWDQSQPWLLCFITSFYWVDPMDYFYTRMV